VLYTPPYEDKRGRPVQGTTRNVADLIFESTCWPHKHPVIREAMKEQGCDRTGGAYAEHHHKTPLQWRHTDESRQHKRPDFVSSAWENRGKSRNQRVQAAADTSESSCSTEPTAKRRCPRSKSRALSRRRADDSRSPEHHGDYRPSGASSSSRQLPVQSQGYSGWYGKSIRESSRARR
jgi:hypothetical protein